MPRGRRKRPPIDLSASPVGVMYDTVEVATFMGVSQRTVQRWIREKRLPAVVVGGSYRVRREDIQNFVKSR